MKLIEVARQQKDILNEGIAYVAFWQEPQSNGKKSWFTEDFFPLESNDGTPTFHEEQLERFTEIIALDENAILLNGLGTVENPLSSTEISNEIKEHYDLKTSLVKNYLSSKNHTDEVEIFEEPTTNEVEQIESDTLTIEIPFDNGYTDFTQKKENLRKLIESKTTLIKTALGDDAASRCGRTGNLPIEFTAEGTVKFEWLKLPAETTETESDRAVTFGTIGDPESVRTAWTEFFCYLIKYAKKVQRITAKDGELSGNPKFDFRVFLVKIGMKSAELKAVRKTLLRNLSGSTAFRTAESENNWKNKHQAKEGAENE